MFFAFAWVLYIIEETNTQLTPLRALYPVSDPFAFQCLALLLLLFVASVLHLRRRSFLSFSFYLPRPSLILFSLRVADALC
jgi:hypothetical protein